VRRRESTVVRAPNERALGERTDHLARQRTAAQVIVDNRPMSACKCSCWIVPNPPGLVRRPGQNLARQRWGQGHQLIQTIDVAKCAAAHLCLRPALILTLPVSIRSGNFACREANACASSWRSACIASYRRASFRGSLGHAPTSPPTRGRAG
jgi:hypothetical protein